MTGSRNFWILLLFVSILCLDLCFGHGDSGSCSSPVHEEHPSRHQCDQSHAHHHRQHHRHRHHHHEEDLPKSRLLPEELAEEEDLKLYGIGSYNGLNDHGHGHKHAHFDDTQLSGVALWVHALGCSFLVSMASLICLILLPLLFIQGKPSKAVVDSLALFGAGAMLGDAFLHQLPHAFGGQHSHSHSHHASERSHSHDHHAIDANSHSGHDHSHGHAHSLEDLSIGISILVGIVLFLLVEKLVRYVEENSRGANAWTHGHHHHHKNSKKLKDINGSSENVQSQSLSEAKKRVLEETSEEISAEQLPERSSENDNLRNSKSVLRKRNATAGAEDKMSEVDGADVTPSNDKGINETANVQSPSNLVFGYLNLFSDGVHNFTDGMALGSAFLLYGPVGGWSRTLFLLAHELPQEVGDFGILVRSGFSVSKALFYNFLSALVALAGTALALVLGRDPGQSSLIEGFTAGGFIYIAVAGVLAEMNNGKTTVKSTIVELVSLMLGMAVALCISLVE